MDEVYKQIVNIAKKYNTKKVVLFGSRARGTNHPKSDIDLAIYGCEDFGDLSDCLNEELWSLLKLDIINMDDKHISPVLVTEIERDGRVLYEKVYSIFNFNFNSCTYFLWLPKSIKLFFRRTNINNCSYNRGNNISG